LDTTIRKRTQITKIRHEPSYIQLRVKMNRTFFLQRQIYFKWFLKTNLGNRGSIYFYRTEYNLNHTVKDSCLSLCMNTCSLIMISQYALHCFCWFYFCLNWQNISVLLILVELFKLYHITLISQQEPPWSWLYGSSIYYYL